MAILARSYHLRKLNGSTQRMRTDYLGDFLHPIEGENHGRAQLASDTYVMSENILH